MAALITFVTMPFIRRLSIKTGAVAVPGGRRKHKNIVPLGVGVAIFLGALIAVLFSNNISNEVIGFLLGATVIAAVGFIDDKFELPPVAKLLGQILAALIVVAAGVKINFVGNLGNGNDGIYYLGFLSVPITFLWIIGLTNAINFIDGIDGLAGGVSGIAAWTLGIVSLITNRYDSAVLCFIIGASAFAFLPYNFSNSPNKKIFMGDSGSGFLGYSLAVLSIMGTLKIAAVFSMLVPIMILMIPLFDMVFAIVRRLLAGKSPFEADRLHLHHRLMDKGLSNRQTVYIIYGITMIFSLIAIAFTGVTDIRIVIVFVLVILTFLFALWKTGLIKRDLKSKE